MIVQNILNYVEEQDISINDFAKKCKLKPTTIYSIINGQSRSPTLSVVQKIADGMDMTIDELTKNDRHANAEIQRIHNAMQGLDEREKELVRAMIVSATKTLKDFRCDQD